MADQPTKTDTQKTDGIDGAARSAAPSMPSSGTTLADLRARVMGADTPTPTPTPSIPVAPVEIQDPQIASGAVAKQEKVSPVTSSDIPQDIEHELATLATMVSGPVVPELSAVPQVSGKSAPTANEKILEKQMEPPVVLIENKDTDAGSMKKHAEPPNVGEKHVTWGVSQAEGLLITGKSKQDQSKKVFTNTPPPLVHLQDWSMPKEGGVPPLVPQDSVVATTTIAPVSASSLTAVSDTTRVDVSAARTAIISSQDTTPNSGILHKKVSHSPLVQAVRTFRSDAMQVVDKNKISMVGAIAAEEEKRILEKKKNTETTVLSSVSPGAYYLLGIASALIILGIATFGVVKYLGSRSPTPANVELPSVIFTEDTQVINIEGMSRTELMNTLSEKQASIGNTLGAITGLYLTTNTPRKNETTSNPRLVTTEEFFGTIRAHAPAALLRALSPLFLLGIHEFSENEPFFIFTVTDYDNAFAGMLAWEPEMNPDLAPLFGAAFVEFYRSPSALRYRDIIKEAATTSTSTGSVRSNPEGASTTVPIVLPITATTSDALRAKGFEDARFRNKEVRVLRNDAGDIVLLYSFLSRDTLVITTNEFTLKEVLTRLTSKRF